MEATVKITNGKITKFVTPAIANDAAVMRRFGYWKDGDLKVIAEKSAQTPQVTTLSQAEGITGHDAHVDLLAETVELTKPQIMDELRAKGIKFNPNDKKEVLQSLLTEGK